MAETKERSRGRRNKWKIVGGVLLLLLSILGVGIGIYLQPYEADPAAVQAMQSNDLVKVKETGGWIHFAPGTAQEPGKTTVIFYPGGLVEPQGYAPFAHGLAAAGYPVYIVKMPVNLAVLGGDRAAEIIAQAPGQRYVIGGHSLGGSMAARFAAANPDSLEGVFLLAAYADDEGSLRGKQLSVLSIVGSADGVLNRERFELYKRNNPESTQYVTLNGGNHSGFGSYGSQKGDGLPEISSSEQLNQTLTALSAWLKELEAD